MHINYIKIPDIIAKVGGVASVMTSALKIIYQFYIDLVYFSFLHESFFRLKIEDLEESSDNKKKEMRGQKKLELNSIDAEVRSPANLYTSSEKLGKTPNLKQDISKKQAQN